MRVSLAQALVESVHVIRSRPIGLREVSGIDPGRVPWSVGVPHGGWKVLTLSVKSGRRPDSNGMAQLGGCPCQLFQG